MTKHEQTKLLEAILDNMKLHIMAKVSQMPNDWDGFELRQYCADKFIEEVRPMPKQRLKEYRNTIAVTTL